MDDFFKTIYDHAVETCTLDFDADRPSRAALCTLDELLDGLALDQRTRTRLEYAIDAQLYRTNVLSLAYGFRLAAQVIRPVFPASPAPASPAPRSCSACP